jgi:hypothetical protein
MLLAGSTEAAETGSHVVVATFTLGVRNEAFGTRDRCVNYGSFAERALAA